MAANSGAKFFRDFFRDSQCRMAFLLKSVENSPKGTKLIKIRERPKTAPVMRFQPTDNLLAVTPMSHHLPVRPVTKLGERPASNSGSTPPGVGSTNRRQQTEMHRDRPPTRNEPHRKQRPTNSGGTTRVNATTEKREAPRPRKPGCKVCLPDDPTGFLLNEIDQVRERILERMPSEGVSCRQAVALAHDIRNRVDAIVVPPKKGERESRIKFIGGRFEQVRSTKLGSNSSLECEYHPSSGRQAMVLEKKMLPSPLGRCLHKSDLTML
ncbi:uncharacterized protein LOC126572245 [Anopheles aquasalis]|uniref:uncharacterized protein LOC126572245 n=1 Tax=Anopheles aquasalis TaxID=42839 RepID=UPI00215A3958|nr:uncharacterized protein LOC126572245 [Anopheles aquasalis]